MTYGEASRYSEIFKALSDPYALVMLDKMFEEHKEYTPEELAKEVNSTEGKVRGILERFCDLGVVDRDYQGDKDVYETTESSYANFLEVVIGRID